MSATLTSAVAPSTFSNATAKPRLGFLGVGWIGRHRMEAVARTGLAEIVGVADPLDENVREAAKTAPGAERVRTLEELFELRLDGLVIATPSAMHSEQAIAALQRGIAVFCQKPLARTGPETRGVIQAARESGRLLAVDLPYRFTTGMQQVRRLVQSGELGRIFAAHLVFHNSYGPDKPWFYDFKLAGGGCLIDLGTHLVDLAYWILGFPGTSEISGRLFCKGEPMRVPVASVEDFAVARVELQTGITLQISCSWNLHAGCEAVICARFYGTNGGAKFQNVNGSFYDFEAFHLTGTKRRSLASGSEDWGGRAVVDWVKRLTEGQGYDPHVESLVHVAETLDCIYGRR